MSSHQFTIKKEEKNKEFPYTVRSTTTRHYFVQQLDEYNEWLKDNVKPENYKTFPSYWSFKNNKDAVKFIMYFA
jgi:nuclear transport factor 2 (NTF2) superfamily protein